VPPASTHFSAADQYPMGRFGPVRRIALADLVYENRWATLPRGICITRWKSLVVMKLEYQTEAAELMYGPLIYVHMLCVWPI